MKGKTVLEAPVYAGKDVSKGTIFSAIGDFFKNLFTVKGLLKLVIVIIVIAIIILIIKQTRLQLWFSASQQWAELWRRTQKTQRRQKKILIKAFCEIS